MATIERRKFLFALGASGLAPSLLGIADGDAPAVEPLDRALVLSGGGARDVYKRQA